MTYLVKSFEVICHPNVGACAYVLLILKCEQKPQFTSSFSLRLNLHNVVGGASLSLSFLKFVHVYQHHNHTKPTHYITVHLEISSAKRNVNLSLIFSFFCVWCFRKLQSANLHSIWFNTLSPLENYKVQIFIQYGSTWFNTLSPLLESIQLWWKVV